jgi:hypothetical protein
MQEVGQINPVPQVAAAAEDLGPPAFNGSNAFRIAGVGAGQPTPVVGAIEKPGLQRDAQIAV